jgi:hypothetical protein
MFHLLPWGPCLGRAPRRVCPWLPGTALLALVLWIGPAARAEAALTASFDYSMPARFAVPPITSGDDSGEVYVNGPISPATWEVDFDACASTGTIAAYHWTIDGTPAGTSATCDGFSYAFPDQGMHMVSLTVDDGAGGEASYESAITVRDWLIVGLGDSYGSGEGNPDQQVPVDAINVANAAQAARDAAQAAVDAAEQVYLQQLASLNATQAQVNDVFQALNDWQSAKNAVAADCPLPVLACAQATAALAAAAATLTEKLIAIGLSNLTASLDFSTISNALNSIRAAAQAALDAAQTALQAAQASLDAVQSQLDAAVAALQPIWQNRRCHRSANSWEVLAAQRIEQSDPHSSVTFLHLACSGATIWKGVIGPYAGIQPPDSNTVPAQVDRMASLVGSRTVDRVLLSIGGNDVNFSSIVTACIRGEPCFDNPTPDPAIPAAGAAFCAILGAFSPQCLDYLDGTQALDADAIFHVGVPTTGTDLHQDGLDDLAAGYQAVADALTAAGVDPAAVYLTEYPDTTRDDAGDFCGWSSSESLAVKEMNLIGLSEPEAAWLSNTVVPQLAATMQGSAATQGWHFVGGIADAFHTHGYCANDHWLVRMQDTFPIEAYYSGMLHPTPSGQAAYRNAVLPALNVPEPGATAAAGTALAALAGLAARRRRARA